MGMIADWSEIDSWIVVAGVLSGICCAIPGCFLLLRRMSMMGDAISHAVLPGIAMAFLLTGDRTSIPMFIGAAAAGIMTAVFTQWVSRFGNVDRGAAMGIVFTTLFALGLIMIVKAADRVDLDPGCVLYGAIELTPLDTVKFFGGFEIPRAVLVLVSMLAINVGAVILFYKELKISSFDPELSDTLGIPSGAIHFGLMTIVALTTVACFEIVGSIIVIAMLIVPAASAFLITRRLIPMIVIACLFAALSAVFGHLGAISLPRLFGFESTITSGMMAVASGVLFLIVWGYVLLIQKFRSGKNHAALHIRDEPSHEPQHQNAGISENPLP